MIKNKKPEYMLDIIPASGFNLSEPIFSEINIKNKIGEDNSNSVLDQINSSQSNLPNIDYISDQIRDEYIKESVDPSRHLEDILNSDIDFKIDLANFGGVISEVLPEKDSLSDSLKSNSKKRNLVLSSGEDDFYSKVIAHINSPIGRTASSLDLRLPQSAPRDTGRIVMERPVSVLATQEFKNDLKMSNDSEISDFYEKRNVVTKTRVQPNQLRIPHVPKKELNFTHNKKKSFWKLWLVMISICGTAAYGVTLKNEIVRDGNFALQNLESARANLENLNFSGAASDFSKSYDDFLQASQNLSLMGAGITGIFSNLPGFDELTAGSFEKINSAKDLAEAGKLLAQSGKAMSEALGGLAETGSILNPNDNVKIKPLKIIGDIRRALNLSKNNFDQAKVLLANIDSSFLPDDRRESFDDFKSKLPLLENYLNDAIGYSDFLEGIIGIDKSKKYLLLFNNNSELRPTGGFPGTYGVISFSNGGLSDFFVDDVYNLDGQLKQNVIPPKQLQHITPTWAMRDSSWFIDFPTSSQKAIDFFSREAGYSVDGVIALNPDIIKVILEILGPVKMPGYSLTLTADNFLESIQEEVEYGPNREQPKTIVKDFAPLLLAKLYSADTDKWLKVFNALMAGLTEKDILFYFKDGDLQDFAIKQGFAGELKNPLSVSGTPADYLHINFSNIKGSKTDIFTDSFLEIENDFKSNKVIRKLKLTREHGGGDHEHGFYNKQNPTYVRILIPDNAEIINIAGQDNPNFRPLLNYNLQTDFERDRDLVKYEAGFFEDEFLGVQTFREPDSFGQSRRGIGFWMIIDPGKNKTVEIDYTVSLDDKDYNFYFQKQSGMDWKNFKFSFKKPEGSHINVEPGVFNRVGELFVFEKEIRTDTEINLKFK